MTDRNEFVLSLRSKTALGRLNTAEVNSVLDYLESIGFGHQVAEPVVAPIEAPPVLAPLAPPPEL